MNAEDEIKGAIRDIMSVDLSAIKGFPVKACGWHHAFAGGVGVYGPVCGDATKGFLFVSDTEQKRAAVMDAVNAVWRFQERLKILVESVRKGEVENVGGGL